MVIAIAKIWARLVRFGFRLLYNEFAFTYDLVSQFVSMGAWGCWGKSALDHLNAAYGDRVLEIAHGTGHVHIELHHAGYQAYGIDLSPNMGQIARNRLQAVNLPARLTRGMAQALPFPSESFAAVVSTFPAEFIIAPETLREVARVLRPGGRFVIVPNAVFTARGAGVKGLEFLYRITGQRADVDQSATDATNQAMAHLFSPFGFDVSIVQAPCPRSLVTVIIAERQRSSEIGTGNPP